MAEYLAVYVSPASRSNTNSRCPLPKGSTTVCFARRKNARRSACRCSPTPRKLRACGPRTVITTASGLPLARRQPTFLCDRFFVENVRKRSRHRFTCARRLNSPSAGDGRGSSDFDTTVKRDGLSSDFNLSMHCPHYLVHPGSAPLAIALDSSETGSSASTVHPRSERSDRLACVRKSNLKSSVCRKSQMS
jgi:hypothetical protein